MKFAVIAPVAAGVTADPAWMAAFAQHVAIGSDTRFGDAQESPE